MKYIVTPDTNVRIAGVPRSITVDAESVEFRANGDLIFLDGDGVKIRAWACGAWDEAEKLED